MKTETAAIHCKRGQGRPSLHGNNLKLNQYLPSIRLSIEL